MPPLLSVNDLKTYFDTRAGTVRAVDGVSFDVEREQTVGIVGESGSGKSVTCYSLLGLIPMPPGRIAGGTAMFDGTDLLSCGEKALRKIRGKRISMIFQDPMTSLNPYMKISKQLTEPLEIHEGIKGKAARHQAIEMMEKVGIKNAESRIDSYPHEFSGGMRQRVMIAMSLITKPDLLIADEPTTALDVTVQKQVLDLIKDMQKELGTAVIFITHDLGVVSETCDEVNVMYAGRFVERAPTAKLFESPLHAYTRALQASIPVLHKKGEDLHSIPGLPPDLTKPIEGCAFKPRNTMGNPDRCLTTKRPPLVDIGDGHWVQKCPGCIANAKAE
ncbi:ABC transporter ATP-binding protein [Sulfuriroseicoccus oceanibius]|uniref:ABC transporter ATP-binding protein n=1 Tax=Sulfuriroseicoccus oceanibius TaxID=2707525 RepID=A0A6B3L522_9BACT|nr:ABC transporter ATP-binding protein [Sulfuriroseicoccus oceanibius]QQL44752.1 ABC transporter ATP-binding protein [Sulfuriroseicoccus oceanibius]